MYGQFERQTKEIRSEESWMWLQRGTLKRETESLITSAQEQALRTNQRAKIEKDGTSPLCRMCKQADETVSHIVSGCSKMSLSEYKRRHDKVATAVHWGLAKNHGNMEIMIYIFVHLVQRTLNDKSFVYEHLTKKLYMGAFGSKSCGHILVINIHLQKSDFETKFIVLGLVAELIKAVIGDTALAMYLCTTVFQIVVHLIALFNKSDNGVISGCSYILIYFVSMVAVFACYWVYMCFEIFY